MKQSKSNYKIIIFNKKIIQIIKIINHKIKIMNNY